MLEKKDDDAKQEVKEFINEILKEEDNLDKMGDVIQADAFIKNISDVKQIEGIAKVIDAVEEPSAEKAKEIYKKIEEMGEIPQENEE